MVPSIGEIMREVSSIIAGLMVIYTIFQTYFPNHFRAPFKRYTTKITNFFYPYIRITFPEYQGDEFQQSFAFAAIERYLNANSTKQAKRLQANVLRDNEAIVLSMADHEEVTDEYQGIKFQWSSSQTIPRSQSISFYPRDEARKSYELFFHQRYRDIVTNNYLKHVMNEGKVITVKERRRRLYTNNKDGGYSYKRRMWSQVVFEHPATFETLAMDPVKKQEIVDDLITFTKAKDYYAKIGKAWKRGYLLYGPPGTGKSTMIAAIANLLKYDVYDLELTSVKDNTELRKLLIDTSSQAVIVIEDIDCSLDLTGQRKGKEDDEKKKINEETAVKEAVKSKDENKGSQVTLSGLLNFIDGLWSSCGSERIIIFTTNYLEKLDPALIRRGRMDKHIELAYCGYEAFKCLAKIYLGIESHELFETIKHLLEETNMTPADVAENLMPKSAGEDEESCLKRLVKALEEAKEEEKRKAEKLVKEAEENTEEKQKLATNDEEKRNVQENSDVKSDHKSGVKENGEVTEEKQ